MKLTGIRLSFEKRSDNYYEDFTSFIEVEVSDKNKNYVFVYDFLEKKIISHNSLDKKALLSLKGQLKDFLLINEENIQKRCEKEIHFYQKELERNDLSLFEHLELENKEMLVKKWMHYYFGALKDERFVELNLKMKKTDIKKDDKKIHLNLLTNHGEFSVTIIPSKSSIDGFKILGVYHGEAHRGKRCRLCKTYVNAVYNIEPCPAFLMVSKSFIKNALREKTVRLKTILLFPEFFLNKV